MQHSSVTTVTIHHHGSPAVQTGPADMALLAGGVFPIAERVPEAEGDAFDWGMWYEAWRKSNGLDQAPRPTHLKVEAADGFEAVMPWEQLDQAAVLYAAGGAPLMKGGPIRIYVPLGASRCLNVKNVVAMRVLHEPGRGSEAAYGFKNVFDPGELVRPRPGSGRS